MKEYLWLAKNMPWTFSLMLLVLGINLFAWGPSGFLLLLIWWIMFKLGERL